MASEISNNYQRRVYTCPVQYTKKGTKAKKQTFDDCENSFAEALGFNIIDTTDNGDCFFHSLQLYGQMMDFDRLDKDIQTLRNDLVDFLLGETELYNQGIYNESAVMQLRNMGIYDCDAGDLPPQYANRAFRINLHIYTFNHDEDVNENYITLIKYNGTDYTDPTVSVIHIGEHYKLLLTHADMERYLQRNQHHYMQRRTNRTNRANRANSVNRVNRANSVNRVNRANSLNRTNRTMRKNFLLNSNYEELNEMNNANIQKSRKYTVEKLKDILKRIGINDFKGITKKQQFIELYRAMRGQTKKNSMNNNLQRALAESLQNMKL
jgi:hypothetical protein